VPAAGALLGSIAWLAFGLSYGLLVGAATLLVIAILSIWNSLELLSGDASEATEEALVLAAPRAEDEQKAALLRALKDLDFERSMGKISEEDYEDLKQRYRTKAKHVLQELDKEIGPARAQAEALISQYLERRGIRPKAEPEDSDELEAADKPAEGQAPAPAVEAPKAIEVLAAVVQPPEAPPTTQAQAPKHDAAEADTTRACPSCSTRNDPDAAFCKKCGRALESTPTVGAEPQ
jgi:hypothetical protein